MSFPPTDLAALKMAFAILSSSNATTLPSLFLTSEILFAILTTPYFAFLLTMRRYNMLYISWLISTRYCVFCKISIKPLIFKFFENQIFSGSLNIQKTRFFCLLCSRQFLFCPISLPRQHLCFLLQSKKPCQHLFP